MRRLGTGTGFAARSCPRSFRSASVARFGQDDRKETWNRYRLRCAKLSEVVARSERSLASVRMTEGAVASLGKLTSLPLPLWEGGTIAPLIWGSGCLRDYFSKICAAQIFGMGHWVQGSPLPPTAQVICLCLHGVR